MAIHKLHFTSARLDKIPQPESGQKDYYKDTETKGLELIVTSGGAKTFYLYAKINYRATRVKIGPFPEITVETARKKAAIIRGKIADGEDPQADRQKIRDEYTFKLLFDEYLERHSKLHKRSWKYDEREVNNFLKPWFNRRISTISKDEVARLHARIGKENGLYAANRILERIRAIYNKAIEWGWEGINPAAGIKKFPENKRERFLTPDEMPRFWQALELEENETARDFIKMLLFAGARKTNTLKMKWEDLDFTDEVWRIPDTKNKSPHTVPLSPYAVEILSRRKKSKVNKWVFPGDGKEGHLVDPKKAWRRILKSAEIKNLVMHDLRRTFGSWQTAVNGANLMIIGKSLGHKSPQSTQIYAHLYLAPVRNSINKATQAMLDSALKKKEAEIITLVPIFKAFSRYKIEVKSLNFGHSSNQNLNWRLSV